MIQRLHASGTAGTAGTESGQEPGSVSELCALFGVSRSGYYDHLHKAERIRRQQDQHLGQQMEKAFRLSRGTYGSPRLVDALHKQGVRCGKNRMRRLMCERGLEAKQKRCRNGVASPAPQTMTLPYP